MITWWKRWRKVGYRKLWTIHFGNEWHKGCEREYNFMHDVLGGWREAYDHTKATLHEAEELLRQNGIEPPTDKRKRELNEHLARIMEQRKQNGH